MKIGMTSPAIPSRFGSTTPSAGALSCYNLPFRDHVTHEARIVQKRFDGGRVAQREPARLCADARSAAAV